MAELKAEKARAEDTAAAHKAQLAEAQDLLRSNQQVITWLNKELNDAQSGARPYAATAAFAATRGAPFRPVVPPGFLKGSAAAPLGAASASAANAAAAAKLAAAEGGPADGGADTSSLVGGGGAALSSLRSRAGMALAEGAGAAGAPRGGETASTAGGLAEYLSPSKSASYGGMPMGAVL